jgi:ABC-type sugar transport system permease subunit
MRTAYRALALLIPVLVTLQAAFIAFGQFGIETWVSDDNSYTRRAQNKGDATGAVGITLHAVIGNGVIPLVALLLLAVAFFARIPRGRTWAAFVLLDVVVQILLAVLAYNVAAVGLLHGVNAFVLFGLAMMAAQRARTAAE